VAPASGACLVILGFMTSNVDELVARVPAAGGKIIQSPKDDPEHGVRVGFVADVDGRLIEVVQMLAA
jgi:predicted enzyme related to lactoylglutathione lyase